MSPCEKKRGAPDGLALQETKGPAKKGQEANDEEIAEAAAEVVA